MSVQRSTVMFCGGVSVLDLLRRKASSPFCLDTLPSPFRRIQKCLSTQCHPLHNQTCTERKRSRCPTTTRPINNVKGHLETIMCIFWTTFPGTVAWVALILTGCSSTSQPHPLLPEKHTQLCLPSLFPHPTTSSLPLSFLQAFSASQTPPPPSQNNVCSALV